MSEAAAELWEQIFARAAAHPASTLWVPNAKDEKRDADRREAALLAAGWSPVETIAFVQSHEDRLKVQDPTSPGVAPWLEAQLRIVAAPIKAALTSKGYRGHEKVLLGIDPTVGVSAALTNVIMTDEGIVSVSSFLFRWCGLIARAYLRTLILDVEAWSNSDVDPEADRRRLLRRPDLVLYWLRIFGSFAATGTHALVPYRPSTRQESLHFEQIAWAMEYFIVGHEYAHHALGHRSADDDPHRQEFEADSLSLFISEMLEREPFAALHNPYAGTGAAANITLRALDTMSNFKIKAGAWRPAGDTHPAASHRIAKILQRHALQDVRHREDRHWNGTATRIMDAVDGIAAEFLNRSGGALDLLNMNFDGRSR